MNRENPNNLPATSENHEIEGLSIGISDYRVWTEGSLNYIVDRKGRKISKGYHEFNVFEMEGAKVLIGKLGAISRLLKIPQNEGDMFEESDASFHEIRHEEKLGLLLDQTGAMSHVVDPQTGREVTKGYHEFFWKGSMLYGRTGAHEEKVEFINSKYLPMTPQRIEGKL